MDKKEGDPAFKAASENRPKSGDAWIRVYLSDGVVPLTVLVDKLAVLMPLCVFLLSAGAAFLLAAFHITGILASIVSLSIIAMWIWCGVIVFRHIEWIY